MIRTFKNSIVDINGLFVPRKHILRILFGKRIDLIISTKVIIKSRKDFMKDFEEMGYLK